ncbi:uncharacterized protein TRIVIDRAFT_153015 [Trichoderma virens Gv29-8]|uniref:NACHT domain-containing protein n=1 Tax=Hypocrea virens (strain Gv29-8 / FGSC 10586) TaxID=413071 RepID=G9MWJ9_HYPVG|nr:uncharacterized protein TRIVIDRAFT_153015 [Trichoderma virens Gv29-8]EHK21166.1 hypothetical protein TRIVIDRAFT_153015 [Trichoderma virens Gv29-8]
MTSVKRSHTDYRVGWICALPKEQTAATAMLDEIHPNLHKPSNDTNTYTLGSIGPHNVVIACLPKGRSGNGSATNVATLMIGSFPSIKIGLLVGIGGGVPSKVRLGDVVVSTPGGQYPGVVQWDFGKATNGIFERTGALSNPPNSLLTALAKLETEYELEGSKIPRFLEELKEKYPMLPKGYFESDSLRDLLFRADYSHVNGPFMDAKGPTDGIAEKSQEEAVEEGPEEGGEVCQFCDQTKIVKRDHQPIRVHHGLIASGNKVVEDGLYRDKLNDTLGGNVLCFEMEAAGLMNNFPCLVIRGICDYCDSHKNKTWQEYAAAVAAAYAKELLGCIQPSNVEDEQLIRDVINEEKLELMETSGRKEDKKKQEEILDWLTSLDFHLLQNDYFRKCQQDTGQEFINSTEVQRWISTAKQTLFSKGDPGAGKTFQMAILVNHLLENFNQENVGVAYLYYNYKTQQNQKPEHMLASLVKQLAQSSKIFPKGLYQLRDRHSPTKTRPFLGELSNALENVIQSFSRVYILIDALDEGDDDDRTTFLREMFAIQAKTKLNLFATSRPISAIGAVFKGSISKAISPSQEDVFLFLNARMSGLPQFVIDDTTLQGEVRVAIESAIGGMFLLAQLYMNALMGKRSPDALREALRDLPHASSSKDKTSVLNQAYDKSMERIQQLKGDMSSDGLFIISWIVNAKRQLKLTELQEALAIAIHTNKSESLLAVNIRAFKLNKDSIPTVDHITESCASLVIVEGDIVKLVHYTAQEYFERSPHSSMTNFHENLMTICMTYLSFSGFRDKSCRSKEDLDKRIGKNPFYSYAAEFWAYHANEAINQNHGDIVELLIQKGAVLEAQTERLSGTALIYAARAGYTNIIQSLIEKGANVEAGDQYGNTPLSEAAAWDQEEAIVKALLDSGKVDVNTKDDKGWTPLRYIIELKYVPIMKTLLGYKMVDVNTKDDKGRTPLLRAVELGDSSIVKALLDSRRPDVNARDIERRTPLRYAIEKGDESIIRVLLDCKNVGIHKKDNEGYTPLLYAMKHKKKSIIQLLFHKGRISANTRDKKGRTPLSHATGLGDRSLVKALLDFAEVEIDAKDNKGRTPLTYATSCSVAKVLLRTQKVDVNSRDKQGRTPIWYATQAGNHKLVELLVRRGAYDGSDARNIRRWVDNGARLVFTSSGGISLWNWIRSSPLLPRFSYFAHHFLTWSALS